MKILKYIIIISFFSSVVAFGFAFWFSSNIEYFFWQNLLTSIFSSNLLMFIISISAYLLKRKEALERYYKEVKKISTLFENISYLHFDAPQNLIRDYYEEEHKRHEGTSNTNTAKDALIDFFENKLKQDVIANGRKEQMQLQDFARNKTIYNINNYDSLMERIIKSYLSIKFYDLSELHSSFSNINFLFGNTIFKNWIDNSMQRKIILYRDIIIQKSNNFKKSKRASSFDKLVFFDTITNLQKEFFQIEIQMVKNVKTSYVYNKAFNELLESLEMLRCKIYKSEYTGLNFSPIYEYNESTNKKS